MKTTIKWILRFIVLCVILISAVYITSCIRTKRLQEKRALEGSIDVRDLDTLESDIFLTYLQNNGKKPVDYIVDKFKNHDVVILGEIHEVQEVCIFIADLIEPLYYRANVTCFAMEVLKNKNTHLANQLVTGDTYDEELAVDILRDAAWPIWGFQEYIDILRAIWLLNQKIAPDSQKFMVLGMDSDWDAYDFFCGSWWRKGDDFYKMIRRDKFMAKVVDREVLGKNIKALVQIGYAHSFTHYRMPAIQDEKIVRERASRFGGILYKKHQDRIFQVCLHQWHFTPEIYIGEEPSRRQPLGGFLEELFEMNNNAQVGFDVENSPFARLRDSESYLFTYQPYVVFSYIAQGYVFLKPLERLNKITWIKNFITDKNFDKARGICLQRDWIKTDECKTPEDLNVFLRKAFEED